MTKLALAPALATALLATQPPLTTPSPVIALQPLAQQVRRLESALAYLGQPLAAAVKVVNQGGVTAPLVVESPNSGRVSVILEESSDE